MLFISELRSSQLTVTGIEKGVCGTAYLQHKIISDFKTHTCRSCKWAFKSTVHIYRLNA